MRQLSSAMERGSCDRYDRTAHGCRFAAGSLLPTRPTPAIANPGAGNLRRGPWHPSDGSRLLPRCSGLAPGAGERLPTEADGGESSPSLVGSRYARGGETGAEGRRRRPGGRWVCWLCGWQRGRVRPRRCGGCGEADGRLRYAPWCGRTIFSKRRESPGIVRATRITPQPRSYFGDKRPAARPSRSPGCLRAPASANARRAERRQQRPLDSGLTLSRGCGVRRLAARFCAVPALSRTGPSDTRTDS